MAENRRKKKLENKNKLEPNFHKLCNFSEFYDGDPEDKTLGQFANEMK